MEWLNTHQTQGRSNPIGYRHKSTAMKFTLPAKEFLSALSTDKLWILYQVYKQGPSGIPARPHSHDKAMFFRAVSDEISHRVYSQHGNHGAQGWKSSLTPPSWTTTDFKYCIFVSSVIIPLADHAQNRKKNVGKASLKSFEPNTLGADCG